MFEMRTQQSYVTYNTYKKKDSYGPGQTFR